MFALLDTLRSVTKTVAFFCMFCFLVPTFFISYATVTLSRRAWLAILMNRYPHLRFAKSNSIRTLVDTTRNQGIFHVLLQIEGELDVQQLKQQFTSHVLNRRNHRKRLSFPYLTLPLISCWGQYAWINDGKDFNIDDHIILAPTFHRGRPLTEFCLQDYVSEIVFKYMQPEQPPWQIFCIPMNGVSHRPSATAECDNGTPYYYLLYRIHHLLLDEQPSLRISDMLLIDHRSNSSGNNHNNNNNNLDTQSSVECGVGGSVFANLTVKPYYLPRIRDCILAGISYQWNEFVYQHDPLESPDIEKKQFAGVKHLVSVILIAIVTIYVDFWKSLRATTGSPLRQIDYLKLLFDREIEKRNINAKTIGHAILLSLDPVNVCKETIFFVWKFLVTVTLMLPWMTWNELQAVAVYVLDRRIKHSTVVGFLIACTPILLGAADECWKLVQLVVTAPRRIYEDLFETKDSPLKHYLQRVSLCGRKVVSWSEKLSNDELALASAAKGGLTETEILLTALSSGLRNLFQAANQPTPDVVKVSARYMMDGFLLGQESHNASNNGLVSLNLPVAINVGSRPREEMKSAIDAIRSQGALNYLTVAQLRYDLWGKVFPVVILKLLLNYLSRRYSITLTEIVGSERPNGVSTVYGHTVKDVIYFRPPQSNTGVSVVIQKYGCECRLACMVDSQISPQHQALTNNFRSFIATMIK